MLETVVPVVPVWSLRKLVKTFVPCSSALVSIFEQWNTPLSCVAWWECEWRQSHVRRQETTRLFHWETPVFWLHWIGDSSSSLVLVTSSPGVLCSPTTLIVEWTFYSLSEWEFIDSKRCWKPVYKEGIPINVASLLLKGEPESIDILSWERHHRIKATLLVASLSERKSWRTLCIPLLRPWFLGFDVVITIRLP